MSEIEISDRVWLGKKPPEGYCSTAMLFEKGRFFRADPQFHRRFIEVVCVEVNLADFREWPFILDEMLRLGKSGALFKVLLRRSSENFSIAAFLRLLFSRSGGGARLISLDVVNGGNDIIIEFEATMRDHGRNSRRWSFGIVWDGKGSDYLVRFLKSLESQTVKGEVELLVCGPRANLSSESIDVRFLDSDPAAERLSNISRKKNQIVSSARFENICIVHNRYSLNKEFISSFDQFGYDFDVCIVPQALQDGTRVPDWVAQGSYHFLTQNYLLEYDQYSPYFYVPGGMIIAKTELLRRIPWNDLATWNMAEDVELSQRLAADGCIPRINHLGGAQVLAIRPEILRDFKSLSQSGLYCSKDVYSVRTAIAFRFYFLIKGAVRQTFVFLSKSIKGWVL